MDFGVPKEVRSYENRVGLTPIGVYALANAGHRVYVEHNAGAGAGFTDEDYRSVGGTVLYSPEEVFGRAEVILKAARITQAEYPLMMEGQVLMSFMHMAVASRDLSVALQDAKITAVAYELIRARDGSLPVLYPTSQVAGRMAPILAGQYLEAPHGGRGILISGVPGVPPAEVVILGGGVVGTNAAQSFLGLGAQVTVLDNRFDRLEAIEQRFGGRVITMFSTPYNMNKVLKYADVVVGAVLVPGQRAPILLTRQMMKAMRDRAVFLDYSIDQGGCAETSRPTTHKDPVYVEEGIIHYAVPNVPARVPRTASHALTNAALSYLLDIGNLGFEGAMQTRLGLQQGVQILKGEVRR
jgi:alanine dehydrogenase